MMLCLMILIAYSVFVMLFLVFFVFFFKQKTAYEMRISDWSSDVCSSDLLIVGQPQRLGGRALVEAVFAQRAAEQLVLEARYARFEIRRAFLARGNGILLTALVMLDGDGGRRGANRLPARGRPIGRLERIELDSVGRPPPHRQTLLEGK